ATPRAQHGGGGPFDARPVDVALGSDDSLAELPVVTDGAADEAAREVERIHGVPLGTAPAAAAVDAEIKPGPGIDRIVGRSRLVIGLQIGSPGRSPRQGQEAQARHDNAIHDLPSIAAVGRNTIPNLLLV